MLKKLRIKIVAVTMLITTAMLCVIFGLVFHFTEVNLERESMGVLQAALDGGAPDRPQFLLYGEAPDDPTGGKEHADKPLGDFPPDDDSVDGSGSPETSDYPLDKEFRGMLPLPYLVLEIDSHGSVRSVMGNYDLALTEGIEPENLARAALDINAESGLLDEYGMRFLKRANPDGLRIALADAADEQEALSSLMETCLLIGIASLLVFFALSFLFARWATRPVERAWQQQTQFISDASHELKTPVTAILANAELLQDPDCSVEDRASYVSNISVVAKQMRELIERLLQLARADNNASKTAHSSVALSELVSDTLLPFEPMFYEKGLTLNSEVAPEVRIEGDAAQLRQLIEILVDNAQKYCSSGGSTTVLLACPTRRKAVLCVENDGEEIAAEELAKLFDRFYRADGARAADGGYGLGLAIARSIVQDHNGCIWAESQDGKNRFCVELPCG